MKSKITSKGQITLPARLRAKLNLQTGDVLEFDEKAPYLKATKTFDRSAMQKVIGRGKARLPQRTADEWIEHLRGSVDTSPRNTSGPTQK
jgi:AbrB family looped-hinge helix DNA binding protein